MQMSALATGGQMHEKIPVRSAALTSRHRHLPAKAPVRHGVYRLLHGTRCTIPRNPGHEGLTPVCSRALTVSKGCPTSTEPKPPIAPATMGWTTLRTRPTSGSTIGPQFPVTSSTGVLRPRRQRRTDQERPGPARASSDDSSRRPGAPRSPTDRRALPRGDGRPPAARGRRAGALQSESIPRAGRRPPGHARGGRGSIRLIRVAALAACTYRRLVA